MTRLFPALISSTLLAATVGGCDTKVDQCNRLINAVNNHAATLADANNKLQKVKENPAAADEFAASIKAANDELAALKFKDEAVAGFANDYLSMLAQADGIGKRVVEATKSTDANLQKQVMDDAREMAKLEETIVSKVNAYCQGQ